ncbi:hypothetical protein RHMOL_Rhmol07G0306100 [Rhododendron molle]|nr:hypothetical protein RHMOL_Rhmol07G0306100 [Rhododendron molle]
MEVVTVYEGYSNGTAATVSSVLVTNLKTGFHLEEKVEVGTTESTMGLPKALTGETNNGGALDLTASLGMKYDHKNANPVWDREVLLTDHSSALLCHVI